ncbi:hypothetical protein GCM10019016_076280 [Streptomyces prasinosporus]|uniref:Uncharacterized protein n=1 Tax=Streptomyces prasinosporus TaxID=68256 RepID=A0ABP6TZB7_9ACTN
MTETRTSHTCSRVTPYGRQAMHMGLTRLTGAGHLRWTKGHVTVGTRPLEDLADRAGV